MSNCYHNSDTDPDSASGFFFGRPENMGSGHVSGHRVRILVVIFLEQAELRAKQQKDLTLDFWQNSVDRMLASNDQPLLDGPGSVSHEAMKTIATERYKDFDTKRREQEAIASDAEDLKAIEDLEKELRRKGGGA